MRLLRISACLVVAFSLTVIATAQTGKPAPAAAGPYKKLAEIKIGGEGGWDYLSVDVAARRLYVSHATKVIVIDMEKNAVVGEIAPANGVHGIAIAADLGLAFVSNGRDNTASVVDLKTLQIKSTVKTGTNPDCILYEPAHKEVYTFNGRSNDATVFDAVSGAVKATIKLPGKPEFAVEDVKAGRIYNNIEDTSQDRRHRHRDARGGGDLVDQAGRGGLRPGDRSRAAPALRGYGQADGGGRQRERKTALDLPNRRRPRRGRVRSGNRPRVCLEQ